MKLTLSQRILTVAIFCGAMTSDLSRAQNVRQPYGADTIVNDINSPFAAGWNNVAVRRAWTVDGNDLGGAIRQAAEAVRDAQGNDAKAAAEKQLTELLGKYFDEDMKHRESELVKLAERLEKLRDLNDRRRAKKEEIIELQAKVALNEADGLGFYNGGAIPRGPLEVALPRGPFREAATYQSSPASGSAPITDGAGNRLIASPSDPLAAPVPIPVPAPVPTENYQQ
jgi:hypothetical protein